MPNPNVREIGTVTDVHGRTVRIGIDCDAVTIGDFTIGLAAMDNFVRMLFSAEYDATTWAQAYGEDEAEVSAHAAAVREERLDAADIAADRRERLNVD